MQLSRIQKFSWEDAPVRLGVGKNMARSIRYWCNAFKVEEDAARQFEGRRELEGRTSSPPLAQQVHPQLPPPPIRRLGRTPTNFGSKLLSNELGSVSRRPLVAITLESAITSCYATAWDFTFTTFFS